MTDEETLALVVVARQHGTTAAAAWSGLTTAAVRAIRKKHDRTFTRGRGHPTKEEIERAKPRRFCPCERCKSHWKVVAIKERRTFIERRSIVPTDRPTWVDEANCRGMNPDIFFPARGASLREVRTVCAGCTVRKECLDFAIEMGEKFGVWGGTSERERRTIRHQRRRQQSQQEAS